MAYSGYCLYEPQFPPSSLLFRETNEFSCSYNGFGAYFSSDVLYPYPASDLGDFFALGLSMYDDGSTTSFFGSSSWDWRDKRHAGEELPYEDYKNQIQGDDNHFSTCWVDDFPKFNNGFTGNSHLNAEQWMGDFPLRKDQIMVLTWPGKPPQQLPVTMTLHPNMSTGWNNYGRNTQIKINRKTHKHIPMTMAFAWISSAIGRVCRREILEACGDAATLLLQF